MISLAVKQCAIERLLYQHTVPLERIQKLSLYNAAVKLLPKSAGVK